MKRDILQQMQRWKEDPERKPLILKGARQVGKTWLMKEFGASAYENYVYFNFDEDPSLYSIFQSNKNPARILELLSLIAEQKILPVRTVQMEMCQYKLTLNSYAYLESPCREACSRCGLFSVDCGFQVLLQPLYTPRVQGAFHGLVPQPQHTFSAGG